MSVAYVSRSVDEKSLSWVMSQKTTKKKNLIHKVLIEGMVSWRTLLRPCNRATSSRDCGLKFNNIKFSKIYHLIIRKGEKRKK